MIEFTVFGHPEAQGSKRAFVIPGKNGNKPRAIVTEQGGGKWKSWRQEVTKAALEASGGPFEANALPYPAGTPVKLCVHFFLAKPPSKKKSVTLPATRPDWDKLARLICDSLSKVVYWDDGQICDVHVSKEYGTPERAEIKLCGMGAEGVRAEANLFTAGAG